MTDPCEGCHSAPADCEGPDKCEEAELRRWEHGQGFVWDDLEKAQAELSALRSQLADARTQVEELRALVRKAQPRTGVHSAPWWARARKWLGGET